MTRDGRGLSPANGDDLRFAPMIRVAPCQGLLVGLPSDRQCAARSMGNTMIRWYDNPNVPTMV